MKELAGLYQNDREFYEKLLAKLKGKIRVGEVDRQIKALIKAEAEARSAQPGIAAAAPPDMSTLAASAREIIECEDVLGLFIEDFSRFIVGEERLAKLLYLASTTRLFDKGMHVAIKGPSSAGKSEIRETVLKYMPPEDVISFTSLSEKALLYFPDDFAHKILSMAEAQRGSETDFQDYIAPRTNKCRQAALFGADEDRRQ